MLSPEVIGGTVGGFIAGFGAAAGMINVLIDRALSRFESKLSKGEDGFITRREVHILLGRRNPQEERSL